MKKAELILVELMHMLQYFVFVSLAVLFTCRMLPIDFEVAKEYIMPLGAIIALLLRLMMIEIKYK